MTFNVSVTPIFHLCSLIYTYCLPLSLIGYPSHTDFLMLFFTTYFFLSLYLDLFRCSLTTSQIKSTSHSLPLALILSSSFILYIFIFSSFLHYSAFSQVIPFTRISFTLSLILSICFFFLRLSHSSYTLIFDFCLSLSHNLINSRSYEELQIVCLLLCPWYLY